MTPSFQLGGSRWHHWEYRGAGLRWGKIMSSVSHAWNPMEPPSHGDPQQEPGYCNLELRTDDILTRFVSHQYQN